MPADLPPNVDLHEQLEAGTALHGNYFYETTVNVDNRVKTVVEKFQKNLNIEMNEHGDYTLVIVNEQEAVNYKPDLHKKSSYIQYLEDQTIQTNVDIGYSEKDARVLSNKQLDSINYIRGQHYMQASVPMQEENYLYHLAEQNINTNLSSAAHMSYRHSPSMQQAHENITQNPETSFGFINYDVHADHNIYKKAVFDQITRNTDSLHIEGYTLESNTEKTLNHELGHHHANFYSNDAFSAHGSENITDILETAYSAADGEITQEEVDFRILQRSYTFGVGDASHYSVDSLKTFLAKTDLSQFKGLSKDEIAQIVLENKDEYLTSKSYRLDQHNLDTLEVTGYSEEVKIYDGQNADIHQLEGLNQFSFVNEFKTTFEPDLPEGVLSPKQAHKIMNNEQFIAFAKMNGQDLNVIQDIADRAYLITTEEDIALGLDKLEYEKPNTLQQGQEKETSLEETPEIPAEMEATYPYDVSPEAQAEMTADELALASYNNEIVGKVWRDVETLEENNLTIDERAYLLKHEERHVSSPNYVVPEGLDVDDLKNVLNEHNVAISYSYTLEQSIEQLPHQTLQVEQETSHDR